MGESRAEMLPIAPFLAIVERAIAEHGSQKRVVEIVMDIDPAGRGGARCSLYRRITGWRTGKSPCTRQKGPPAQVTLGVADRIVTRLLGPDAWHSDPVLAKLYERQA